MALVRARVLRALIATAVLIAAGGCTGDDPLPSANEPGWAGAGTRVPGDDEAGDDEGDDDAGDDEPGDDDAGASCTDQGGRCMSDPDDPNMPAFCEALELVEIEAACADLDQSCCASEPASQCAAAGGQCLADPAGGGVPIDCDDLGLVNIGATCPDIDQTCCG